MSDVSINPGATSPGSLLPELAVLNLAHVNGTDVESFNRSILGFEQLQSLATGVGLVSLTTEVTELRLRYLGGERTLPRLGTALSVVSVLANGYSGERPAEIVPLLIGVPYALKDAGIVRSRVFGEVAVLGRLSKIGFEHRGRPFSSRLSRLARMTRKAFIHGHVERTFEEGKYIFSDLLEGFQGR